MDVGIFSRVAEGIQGQGGSGLGSGPEELAWEMPREGGCFTSRLCWLLLHLLTARENQRPQARPSWAPCRCPQGSSAAT